jgi:putative ABC transport system substrate-binding protein
MAFHSLGVAMRRRDFIKIIGGGAAVLPLSARAQQATVSVVGYLSAGAGSSGGDARAAAAFFKGLGETGYQDGKNVKIEYR